MERQARHLHWLVAFVLQGPSITIRGDPRRARIARGTLRVFRVFYDTFAFPRLTRSCPWHTQHVHVVNGTGDALIIPKDLMRST